MAQAPTRVDRGPVLVVAFLMWSGTFLSLGLPHAAAEVTAVTGHAFNYYTDVSLFDGPSMVRGHGQPGDAPADATSPSVECPEEGGRDSAIEPDGARGVYGPATIFGGIWPWPDSPSAPPSGPLTSEIDCQLGEDGYVTSSTLVTLMPGAAREGGHRPDEGGEWGEPTPTWSPPEDYPHPGGIGPGPLIADEVESTCTMAADGTVSSDVRFENGFVETSYNPDTQEPATWEDIPAEPLEGLQISGTIDHVGDRFRITFNEQIENEDGSFTVNAARMELLGPIAVGEMVVGQSRCGVTATPADTTEDPAETSDEATPPATPSSEDVAAGPTGDDAAGGLPLAAIAIGALLLVAIVVGALLARRARPTGES